MNRSIATICSLEARQLTKTFQDGAREFAVLQDLELSVARSEMVAIMGLSGAGKSTLLHLLGALDTPSAGEVWIDGRNLTAMSPNEQAHFRNAQLGFVYQFHHLLPEFSVLENVAMPLLIRKTAVAEARARSAQALEQVGLGGRGHGRVQTLSGGERQRVAIARALVGQPHCILADEPTGNLDQHTAHQVFSLMRELNQRLGTSFVVVTHNESLAKQMDRVLVLKNGKLECFSPSQA